MIVVFTKNKSIEEVEIIYDLLASAIDAVGEEKSELMLAKLALISANLIDDQATFEAALEAAQRDL